MRSLIEKATLAWVLIVCLQHPAFIVVLAIVLPSWVVLLWCWSGCAAQDLPAIKTQWRSMVKQLKEM